MKGRPGFVSTDIEVARLLLKDVLYGKRNPLLQTWNEAPSNKARAPQWGGKTLKKPVAEPSILSSGSPTASYDPMQPLLESADSGLD